MGTPCMGFLQDEFKMSREKSAWTFGAAIFVLGLPTVLFFKYGVFDEYDYWAGTISLVVFALLEIILFAWIFGMEKGWKEITSYADIKVPVLFKFIIKWVTPTLLLFVFIGAFFKPVGNDWSAVLQGRWVLDDGSVVNTILNSGLHKTIAATTDAMQLEELNKQLMYINLSRMLLVAMFATVASLVYIAYRKRVKEGRWS